LKSNVRIFVVYAIVVAVAVAIVVAVAVAVAVDKNPIILLRLFMIRRCRQQQFG